MKKLSETLVTNYDEIAELKGQLAELRKNKEREIRQLEVAIYDGKKEAGVLRQMLAEMHEVNAELHKEIAELNKDKERLDWMLNSYLLSCGITREEVDEKMAKLAELRNATKAELRNATNPVW